MKIDKITNKMFNFFVFLEELIWLLFYLMIIIGPFVLVFIALFY